MKKSNVSVVNQAGKREAHDDINGVPVTCAGLAHGAADLHSGTTTLWPAWEGSRRAGVDILLRRSHFSIYFIAYATW